MLIERILKTKKTENDKHSFLHVTISEWKQNLFLPTEVFKEKFENREQLFDKQTKDSNSNWLSQDLIWF